MRTIPSAVSARSFESPRALLLLLLMPSLPLGDIPKDGEHMSQSFERLACGLSGHRDSSSAWPPSRHRLGPFRLPSDAKLRGQRLSRARRAQRSMGLAPVSQLWPRCGPIRDRSAPVQGPMRPTVGPQSTPCRLSFTLSPTRIISAKRAEVHQNLSRRPSPRGTATRRWPVKCRRGHHGVQTRGARAADHGIRRWATRASAGTEPVGRYR
jgi:hypothetical protein